MATRRLVAVVEHFLELATDRWPSDEAAQCAEGDFVVDLVAQESPIRAVREHEMPVMPGGEWPGDLAVGEEVGRVVLGVLGDPAERDGSDPGLQDDSGTWPGRSTPLD